MDHKRIEWLFLIVFLLIDVYLGIEILRSPVNLSNSTGNTNSSTIRAEMRADGIEVPDNISKNPTSAYYLASKNVDYFTSHLSSLTNVSANYSKTTNILSARPKREVVVNNNKKQILDILNNYKNNPHNVLYGKQYKYAANLSTDDSYVFVQTSEYGDIYDTGAMLIFYIKNHVLESYTQNYLGPVSPVREMQSTNSPWHAISTMYTNRELSDNSKVVKISLGYCKLTEVRGSTILIPAWLVWIENKASKNITLKRVNAFTDQIIQSNTESDYSYEK